ncbi:hypothetical protein RE474_09675 [Methanolobus sediminis]|uniref:Uncharacterized protein n=1 Tax=Methanolobus sediminis TaxID=3072978 RepID=A0AA51YLB7_9EURY|nr:hypothetical protein [Methanolobus sediminis]WMW24358.1 hypothetical protein RE474_09675 [Methanolobus sediminis]
MNNGIYWKVRRNDWDSMKSLLDLRFRKYPKHILGLRYRTAKPIMRISPARKTRMAASRVFRVSIPKIR